MLQIPVIKNNKDQIIAGLTKKHFTDAAAKIDHILDLDQKRRSTQQEHDQALAESKSIAKSIGRLLKEGKNEEADKAKKDTASLKEKIKNLGQQQEAYEQELHNELVNIPNPAHPSVPEGNSDEDNETIFTSPDNITLSSDALPHWELIKKYDIIDFELGNKITGAGFPVYKGQGARLQRAMVNFFLEEALKEGYFEIQPPILVNEDSGYGTGQLPDKDGQMYHIPDQDFYLIPTAEVPITNLYREVILEEKDLPVKNVGFTPCFRREAGSWGSHVRGLNRLHQFDKVEVVQIQTPEKSYETLEEMTAYVSGLLQKLGLPYRILKLCGGDLGFAAAFTYDMEVYSAAQDKWLEVSSVSNFESYQANRLKLRYKKDKTNTLLHTLNGSALALPRILAAILENNQTPDGIKIPEVLQPYTGFKMIEKNG